MRCRNRLTLAAACLCLGLAGPASSQDAPPTGLEVGAVPAINFDSDEGFGYGVIAEFYQYGDGGRLPYVWTFQPTVFLTTEGRRDLVAFFDAPHLLPRGWRLTGFVGTEKQIATPYYGLGNESVYDETLDADEGPNPFYYRFGRTRNAGSFALQRGLWGSSLRFLIGAGVERTTIDPVPEDDGTTLYATEFGGESTAWWSNYVRAGLVWDTRDRETGTRSGTWTEVLLQRTDGALGADFDMTRWTFTDRRYFSLTDRLVFAHRWGVQQVGEGVPAHELFRLQTSFKQQEGLGGAKTVRGVLKNRLVGRGMLLWNAELRWRVAEFSLVGKPFHAVLSGFVDQGRVWENGIEIDQLFSSLHRGYGGGARLGMGENFVVALDIGTSRETGMPIYIGLGYLY